MQFISTKINTSIPLQGILKKTCKDQKTIYCFASVNKAPKNSGKRIFSQLFLMLKKGTKIFNKKSKGFVCFVQYSYLHGHCRNMFHLP